MTKCVSYAKWKELKEYRDYLVSEVHNDWADAQCERINLALEEYPDYYDRYYSESEPNIAMSIGFKISFLWNYSSRCLSFYGDNALDDVFLLKDILKANKVSCVIEEIYEDDKN